MNKDKKETLNAMIEPILIILTCIFLVGLSFYIAPVNPKKTMPHRMPRFEQNATDNNQMKQAIKPIVKRSNSLKV